MKNKSELEKKFNEAEKFKEKGDLIGAIKIFKDILKIKPNFLPALNNIANCYFQRNQIDLAESFYLKCLDIHPVQNQTINNLSLLYFRKNQFKEALRILKNFLIKKPNQEDIVEKIAYCLLELDLKEDTDKFCKDALKIYSKNNKILYCYRKNLFKFGRNKEGLKVLQKETGLIEFSEHDVKII